MMRERWGVGLAGAGSSAAISGPHGMEAYVRTDSFVLNLGYGFYGRVGTAGKGFGLRAE
jgi:hypothetical protein